MIHGLLDAQEGQIHTPTSNRTSPLAIVKRQTFSITLVSAFRDSMPYADRYLRQVAGLYELLAKRGDTLTCVWGEGDSRDATPVALATVAADHNATIVDCTHGGPAYGSVEDERRFKQLAFVGNQLWAAIPETTDVVVYVESDLIWSAATLLALIDATAVWPAVAPMVMHDRDPGLYAGDGPFFYDRWAFRRGGVKFSNEPPYHPDICGHKPLQLDSAGSCLALRWRLAQWLYFPPDCFVGFCRLLYEREASLWLLPSLIVRHP